MCVCSSSPLALGVCIFQPLPSLLLLLLLLVLVLGAYTLYFDTTKKHDAMGFRIFIICIFMQFAKV